ncbi:sensor histidine kinase [Streptomyces rapamycinicus]|uniref:histidine kinase n=1 Tax=Streptomyces rapamycinicus TaxID=1226757 RepID=A0ABR6LB01_9ACTN|nr:sensor histidine kinase [Streptomyces rapamycinicus]MBB4779517.1 signal transduction histidine kinase [Streptomyces rapamycinicus]UTP28286.1 sensor histidine kinase [Streptomyces rapamycinicus NRRL 5491]
MRIVRWRPRTGPHLLAVDACVAGVVTAAYVALAGQGGSDGLPRFSGPVWVGWLVAAGVGAPLAARRLWPLPALVVVLGATAAATLLDITRDPYLATALALYAVALLVPPRRTEAALALTLAVSAAAVIIGEAVLTPSGPWPEAAGTVALVWLVTGGAWAAGRAVRQRRARAARRERRLAEEALAEERLCIARELHDIVSHSLSVIVVKASVANHVAEERPEETRDAIGAIERTGREALTEMRRALGMLRGDPATPHTPGDPATPHTPGGDAGPHKPGADAAQMAPPPGLDDLPALVRRAERAGIRAGLRTRLAADLPAGTALTVYRIVQEALTNVVKHAGDGTHCEVTVTADTRGQVHIEVADDGAGRAPLSGRADLRGGHGLVGMRERVMMYGGTLRAGPRPGGGFAVSVRLPAGPAHGTASDRREPTA